jgi:hypothetical protein
MRTAKHHLAIASLLLLPLVACGDSDLPVPDGAAASTLPDATPPDGSPADAAISSAPDAGADRTPAADFRDVMLPNYDAMTLDLTGLVVSPTAFAFPDTPVGERSQPARYRVTNRDLAASGPVSHVIHGDDAPEFLIVASTCGQPLVYNSTCELSVVFQPIRPGSKSARLSVSASPGGSFTVILTATAASPAAVRLEPASFDFPTTAVASPMPPVTSFTLANRGGMPAGPATASLVGADVADFGLVSNSCEGSILQPMDACSIGVRFRPATAGPKQAFLQVAIGAVVIGQAVLVGQGGEPASISVTPTAQSFGMVPLGMKSAYSFEVKNLGETPAGKPAFSLEGQNFTEFSLTADPSCAQPLEGGFSCAVTVSFAPTLPGAKTASLRVTSSPGGLARVDLNGTGISLNTQGMLTLTSPLPDPFGTVSAGESSVGFFVVENKGTMPTGKINATISGSNATEFTVAENGCPDMLPVSSQCGISVRFSPVFAGRRTANLQVSAFPGGFATLPLSGNAITPLQLRISPTARNFGNRTVGSTTMTPVDFVVSAFGAGFTGPLATVIEGADAGSFQIVYDDCKGVTLRGGMSCRLSVRFIPMSAGAKSATLGASGSPGGVVRSSLTGTGI